MERTRSNFMDAVIKELVTRQNSKRNEQSQQCRADNVKSDFNVENVVEPGTSNVRGNFSGNNASAKGSQTDFNAVGNTDSDSEDEMVRLAIQSSLMMMRLQTEYEHNLFAALQYDNCALPISDHDVEEIKDDVDVVNNIDSEGCADNHQFVCDICTETSDDRLSYGCTHYYCSVCIKTTLETAINDGEIQSFHCPAPECEVHASENFIKTVVSAASFERYNTLMLKKAVDGMDDIIYCPVVECGAMIETSANSMTECYKCSHLICTLCSKLYHGNTDCELTEDERTENLRTIRDEELAEQIFLEESGNLRLIEELERKEEEVLRRLRDEQAEIRRMEQIGEAEEERMKEVREQATRELQEQRRREEEEYQKTVRENEEWEKRQQQKLNERRKADQDSENTITRTTKKCPSCKSPIEKNEGCIHMTCIKCRHEFCWGCMTLWSHDHICPSNRIIPPFVRRLF